MAWEQMPQLMTRLTVSVVLVHIYKVGLSHALLCMRSVISWIQCIVSLVTNGDVLMY